MAPTIRHDARPAENFPAEPGESLAATLTREQRNLVRLGYSPRDAAEVIGVSRSKLYQLIGEGRIEAKKIDSRTVIPAESLQSFIDNLPAREI